MRRKRGRRKRQESPLFIFHILSYVKVRTLFPAPAFHSVRWKAAPGGLPNSSWLTEMQLLLRIQFGSPTKILILIPMCVLLPQTKHTSASITTPPTWPGLERETKQGWVWRASTEWRLLDVIRARPEALARLGGRSASQNKPHERWPNKVDKRANQKRVSTASHGKSQTPSSRRSSGRKWFESYLTPFFFFFFL